MTLIEMMIALGIVGFVLLACYSSSIALQRSFGYTSAWTEARVNQVRVLDSLAVDLRNATKIDFTPPALITLTVPNRYSSYYQNTGAVSDRFNAAAGDPTYAASPTPAPPPNLFGKITYSDTISVSYAVSPDGTTIQRTVKWPTGPVNGAFRDVATFPNRATVTFTPSSPTIITSASNVTMITARIQTSPDYLRSDNPSILEDKVFLREISIK